MSDDELLREAISRLAQTLAGERTRREEAEATLAGLRCMAEADDLTSAEVALLSGLKPLLGYQASALLRHEADDPTVMTSAAADHPALSGRRLTVGPLLRRVLAGKPVAVYDVHRSPDLAGLADTPEICSVLCVPLLTSERPAVLVATHPQPSFFSPRHVSLARRVARTVTRMLEYLVAREQAQHRRTAEERAATLLREKEAAEAARELLEVRVRERTADLVAQNLRLADALGALHRAQEQLVQAEKMASLGLLVAGIAHELKNPLNFVKNFAELSLEFADEIDAIVPALAGTEPGETLAELLPELTENVRRILEHGRRADGIIGAMLLHAREGAGEPVVGDLNALVHAHVVLAYQGFRAGDRSFRAEVVEDYGDGLASVPIAYSEVSRVVTNLVANACHALRGRARRSGEEYAPLLTVTTRSDGERAFIRIADNGTGIEPELRRRIFDPFFTTKPPGEGTGLGLSICYDVVVAQLGGSLDLESALGEGSAFTVMLPLRSARAPGD